MRLVAGPPVSGPVGGEGPPDRLLAQDVVECSSGHEQTQVRGTDEEFQQRLAVGALRELAACDGSLHDLRARHGLDDEDLRALGARLAESADARAAANIEFAERFTDEHRETFDRLAQ